MRILDQPDRIAKWIGHRCHLDSITHIVHRRDDGGACADEVLHGSFDIVNPPVRDGSSPSELERCGIRIEPKLIAGNAEADVERLIEIRLLLEGSRIPGFRARQIGNVIDDRAETFYHDESSTRIEGWRDRMDS